MPVKRALDYTVKVRVASDGKSVDTNDKQSMNPFDEIAVEEAVRLKEQLKDGVSGITLVSAGPAKTVDILRKGLAMGADDAIHVKLGDKETLEPLAVSKVIAELVKSGAAAKGDPKEVGLVIAGKQAIDDDASQTGQMLAAHLNWPQATFASKLELLGTPDVGQEVQVTREIDGGLGVVKTKFPFVLTTDLRLNGMSFSSDSHVRSLLTVRSRAPLCLAAQHHEGKEEADQDGDAEGPWSRGRGQVAPRGAQGVASSCPPGWRQGGERRRAHLQAQGGRPDLNARRTRTGLGPNAAVNTKPLHMPVAISSLFLSCCCDA